MATKNVDYNRGLTKKIHLKTGVDVYMYKDTPGVYLNAYGTPVTEDFAKEAGFDTVTYGKEKLKRERIAQVTAMVEAELSTGHTTREIVEEVNGFKVIHIGLERYTVEDPDANVLTGTPLPLDTASKLLSQLNPGYRPPEKQLPPVLWTKPDPQEEQDDPSPKEVVQPKPMNFGERMKKAKEAKKKQD